MTPLGQIFGYLSGALIIVIMMLGAALYSYRTQLAEAVSTGVECHLNKATVEQALAAQNGKIKALEIDYAARVAAIKPITKVVVKERLKVVHVDRNVTLGECNEVLDTIDALRRADF